MTCARNKGACACFICERNALSTQGAGSTPVPARLVWLKVRTTAKSRAYIEYIEDMDRLLAQAPYNDWPNDL